MAEYFVVSIVIFVMGLLFGIACGAIAIIATRNPLPKNVQFRWWSLRWHLSGRLNAIAKAYQNCPDISPDDALTFNRVVNVLQHLLETPASRQSPRLQRVVSEMKQKETSVVVKDFGNY